MSETKPKQVILTGKSANHRKTPETFLNDVIELAVQGYVLHPKPATLRQLPRFMGRPSCTMVTKEYAKEIIEAADKEVVETKVEVQPEVETKVEQPSITDEVKAIESKAGLLAFAEEKGLSVPQDKKVPKAIQKWLIQELTK